MIASLREVSPNVIVAFVVVYFVWGSTYLAIRIMVESLPPFLASGIRFLLAGLLIAAYAEFKGQSLIAGLKDWRMLLLTGLMVTVGGSGLVTWSEQWVESNQAALIVATSALWVAWLGSLGSKGQPVSGRTLMALLLGFVGVCFLVGQGIRLQLAPWPAYVALLFAPFFWALGSIIAKRNPSKSEPLVAAALQTIIGGCTMIVIALLIGEKKPWVWETRSLFALLYLTIFGTAIAYASYYWLVHQVSPSALATVAYVNPAVAVILGAIVLGETLGPVQIMGTLIILISVLLVSLFLTPWRIKAK